MRAEVVIVGGGVMGVSIAWHLTRRFDPLSQPVVLLEKSELAAGSSGRSGGVLRQFYSSRELAGMARDSLKVFAAFQRQTGRSCGFRRSGVLTIASKRAEDVEMVRRNVEMMLSIGIDVLLVDPDEIRAIVPGLRVDEHTVGAFEPDAGFVDPIPTVTSFAELAKSHGATMREGTAVERVLIEDGAVVGVEVVRDPDSEPRREIIETDRVVLAAGPWSQALLADVGVELPLTVVRPEQHFVEMPTAPPTPITDPGGTSAGAIEARLRHELEEELDDKLGLSPTEAARAPHPVLLDFDSRFYARCDPDHGRTRIGGVDLSHDDTVADPDRLDEDVSEPFRTWARETLERRLPIYADKADVGSLAAMYTLTPDAEAAIGETSGLGVKGLYVVTGFSGHGFKLAPSIGEGVAQLVCGEPVSAFDPEFFALQRLADPDLDPGRGFGL